MRKCRHCGRSIEGKRANAIYCSKSCRVMATRKRHKTGLPSVMTESVRWVSWKPVRRGDRWTKVPITVTGRYASSTNPRTWSSWDEVACLDRKGWVLGNGIGCIDLDHCLENGVIADWAQAVIDEHRSSAVWIEVSPSGTGVHIFLPLKPGSGRVIRDGRSIEIYPPDSGRYICVTGKQF